MTKDDLKTLAMLPKVLSVLRRLANEAQELQGLAAALNIMGAPSQAGPGNAGALRTPRPAAPPEPALTFAPVALDSPNLLTPEREEYQAELTERQREQREYLESQRGLKALKMQQFQHDAPEDA